MQLHRIQGWFKYQKMCIKHEDFDKSGSIFNEQCILANIWKSEIRTFSPFWPSECRRQELPLHERFLWGAEHAPPENF